MSTNVPGEPNWPNPQRTDADLAIDPSTSPAVLASLAEDRPAVRHLVATNPSAPVHILMWLHELRDPAIDLALSRNPTATSANVVRPGLGAASTAAMLGATAATEATPAPPADLVEPVVVGAAPAAPAAAATAVLDDHRGRRWATWAILLVPVLALAGIYALARLVSDGTSNNRIAGATSSVVPTLAPVGAASTQPTAAPTATPTAAPTTPAPPAPVTEPPTDAAPPTTARRPASTSATTRAPTATTRTATTVKTTTATTAKAAASVSTTAVPPTVLAVTVVPTTTPATVTAAAATTAANLAQRLATALASSDWATARKLNPTGALTDAQYGKDYGNLTDSTVVVVKTTAVSANVYNQRLGLVAHETTPAGVRSTLLYCVHWNVDTGASTIVRVDGTKVGTLTGRVEVATVTAQLKTACASANLK